MTPITWYLYGRSGGAKKAAEEIGVKGSVSGDIAVISDGADDVAIKSLVAEITPVQDLHGQANPYPAGGGKNLIPYPYTSQAGTYSGVTVTVNTDGTLVLNGTATATVFWDLKSGADAVPMTAGSYILHRPSTTAVTGLTITVAKDGNYWNMASQANTNLTLESDANVSWYIRVDNGTALSNVKVYPMFEKGTTASDWSPYENICPISGRTGLTVTRAGKNLANFVDGYSVDASGNVTPTAKRTATIEPIIINENIRYRYSMSGSGACIYAVWKGDTLVRRVAGIPSGSLLNTSGGDRFYVSAYGAADLDVTKDAYHPMVTVESADYATYEPYHGATYPITWESIAGTVYGGTLDVVSGVLTVDKAMATFDGSSDEGWAYYSVATGNLFRTLKADRIDQIIPSYPNNYWCNAYKVAANTTAGRTNGTFSGNATNVDFVDDRYPTVEDWRAALAQTPIQFVYPLATPQTYQLTPTEVRTILGGNTIYTDAGSVSVDYIADTKLYIDNKVAELQALVLEN